MKLETLVTFALFLITTGVAICTYNPYIAIGSAFFAGGFFFILVGLTTEKELEISQTDTYKKGYINGFNQAQLKYNPEPSFTQKKAKEINRLSEVYSQDVKHFQESKPKVVKKESKNKYFVEWGRNQIIKKVDKILKDKKNKPGSKVVKKVVKK